MKRVTLPPAGWSPRRFISAIVILFVAQAGLIMLFGERIHRTPARAPVAADFRLLGTPLSATELFHTFFASDPTAFPLASLQGFSDRGWLRLPPEKHDAPEEMEAPAWLTLNLNMLGTNFPTMNGAKSFVPFGLADRLGPQLEPWPVFLAPEMLRTQSVFEIQGQLSGRMVSAAPRLKAWPSSRLLTNSIVQLAVDSFGQVVAARLLARSGSPEADSDALDQARRLRFEPAPRSSPVWGRAIFEWQTIEPRSP